MKNFTLTLCFFALALVVSAADIKVDRTGSIAGSVTNISAAIGAATNGDRIVVFSNGLVYTENVTIDKSLTFLCAAEGEYFFISGNVSITPANGRNVTIVGMHLNGNLSSGGVNPVGARCTVSVVDCEVSGTITFNQDGYNVNLLYCNVWSNTEIRYGKIIANQFGQELTDAGTINGIVNVTAESASYGSGDTIFIIANRMVKTDNLGTANYGVFNFDNANQKYFIANNSFRSGLLTNTGYTTSRVAVNIVNCYITDSANVFINNYCSAFESSVSCNSSSTWAAVQLKGIRTENLVNNIFKNRYAATYGCGALMARGDYNYYEYYRAYPVIADHNIFRSTNSYTYDQVTGQGTAGLGIDAGKPGVNYMDLDLTRADIGTNGGPWSQANYWGTDNPQGGRARVYLLNMPANIYSLTTPVSIKADATHTK